MKTRLLEGEKLVIEFHEEPVCDNLCHQGFIRRMQLATRRIIYYESRRSLCCIISWSTLCQVFLKDITEIANMGYRKPSESLLSSFIYFLIGLICFQVVNSSGLLTATRRCSRAGMSSLRLLVVVPRKIARNFMLSSWAAEDLKV